MRSGGASECMSAFVDSRNDRKRDLDVLLHHTVKHLTDWFVVVDHIQLYIQTTYLPLLTKKVWHPFRLLLQAFHHAHRITHTQSYPRRFTLPPRIYHSWRSGLWGPVNNDCSAITLRFHGSVDVAIYDHWPQDTPLWDETKTLSLESHLQQISPGRSVRVPFSFKIPKQTIACKHGFPSQLPWTTSRHHLPPTMIST